MLGRNCKFPARLQVFECLQCLNCSQGLNCPHSRVTALMAKPAGATKRRTRHPVSATLYQRIVRVLQNEIVSGKHPVGARLPFDSLTQLRSALAAAYPFLVRFDVVASSDAGVFGQLAVLGGAIDKAPFAPAVADFYLTNPIARASRVMAECSALRRGVQREAAE